LFQNNEFYLTNKQRNTAGIYAITQVIYTQTALLLVTRGLGPQEWMQKNKIRSYFEQLVFHTYET